MSFHNKKVHTLYCQSQKQKTKRRLFDHWTQTRTAQDDERPSDTNSLSCVYDIQALEFIVGAEQQRLLRVAAATDGAVGAGDGRRRPLLQCGLLSILLVGRREVVDGVLDHVARAHGLLQAAGDAPHGRAAACKKGSG